MRRLSRGKKLGTKLEDLSLTPQNLHVGKRDSILKSCPRTSTPLPQRCMRVILLLKGQEP